MTRAATPRLRAIGPARAVALLAVALALLARTGGRAWAGPPGARARAAAGAAAGTGLDLLDAGVVVAARLDPGEIEHAAALARSLGGDATLDTNLASLLSAGALGFDLLARAGWRSVGLDDGAPLWVSIALPPPARPGTAAPPWHARLVVRGKNLARAEQWARTLPLVRQAWTAGGPATALVQALGATPHDAAAAARALASAHVILAGTAPGAAARVFVRRAGDLLVLDAVGQTRGAAPSWNQDRALLVHAIAPPDRPLSRLASAGAQALARPGLVLWTRPGGPHQLIELARRLGALSRPTGGSGPVPGEVCEQLGDAARGTALVDLAVAVHISGREITTDATWGVRPSAGDALVAAFPVTDDGLIGPPRHAGGSVLSGSVLLASLSPLMARPRAPALADGWVPLWHTLRYCGAGPRAEVELFLWPDLAGQWLTETAATSPDAATLLAGLRNLAFAARRVSLESRLRWRAVAEASVAPAGRAVLQAILDAVFGARRSARGPRRHVTWGHGLLVPYWIARRHRPDLFGAGFGAASVAWRLRQALPVPRRAPAGLVARVAGDLNGILRQVAPELTGAARTLGKSAASRVGSFAGTLTLDRSAVRARITVRRP